MCRHSRNESGTDCCDTLVYLLRRLHLPRRPRRPLCLCRRGDPAAEDVPKAAENVHETARLTVTVVVLKVWVPSATDVLGHDNRLGLVDCNSLSGSH